MLQAMRLVEESLAAGYRDAVDQLRGFERDAMQTVLHRATKHVMVLSAHIARRKDKDADSTRETQLPFSLDRYFATEEDRVCMRGLLDRPGERAPLEKKDPYTYLCAACHDEVVISFPPDLEVQVARWSAEARRDRVLQHAFGRAQRLRAIREVQAELAGLPPEMPAPAAGRTVTGTMPTDVDS